jgi:hypothetical protein
VRRRATAAKVRVIPLEPVAAPGVAVGFVVAIAAIKRLPGVMNKVWMAVPAQLRVTLAPGANHRARRSLRGAADALVNGGRRPSASALAWP